MCARGDRTGARRRGLPGYRTPAGEFGPEFVLGIDEAKGFFDEGTP
ncbi:hypothetical protein [Halalkalicoccus salilacus]